MGVIGFIPVIFFPTMNQTDSARFMQQINPALIQQFFQPQEQQRLQQQPHNEPVDQRLALYNDYGNTSAKQIIKRRVRGRKAKVDATLDTPVIESDEQLE